MVGFRVIGNMEKKERERDKRTNHIILYFFCKFVGATKVYSYIVGCGLNIQTNQHNNNSNSKSKNIQLIKSTFHCKYPSTRKKERDHQSADRE
ncbi:hypothetical protein DFA_03704 [Cavenderia fasciculata]|uniref:Uncharacterized protein n=1 Tax=Cavenderia fasciculata TaxID=261658 RepID=F4Q1R7_CACFS|nr:uncharacterized protein DFA_03704 [Cavenderia fasciculata]EGG18217.1 hypothetical protein DFA_03704 [Cavenderia fasciculata]|eukprot:XP_004357040.1 hypothetical protein DFA_03704 [Cavenderia fasciculata]